MLSRLWCKGHGLIKPCRGLILFAYSRRRLENRARLICLALGNRGYFFIQHYRACDQILTVIVFVRWAGFSQHQQTTMSVSTMDQSELDVLYILLSLNVTTCCGTMLLLPTNSTTRAILRTSENTLKALIEITRKSRSRYWTLRSQVYVSAVHLHIYQWYAPSTALESNRTLIYCTTAPLRPHISIAEI